MPLSLKLVMTTCCYGYIVMITLLCPPCYDHFATIPLFHKAVMTNLLCLCPASLTPPICLPNCLFGKPYSLAIKTIILHLSNVNLLSFALWVQTLYINKACFNEFGHDLGQWSFFLHLLDWYTGRTKAKKIVLFPTNREDTAVSVFQKKPSSKWEAHLFHSIQRGK